jgi:hypothetical protein
MIDLAALLSAVKPKERTDQYKILSALYVVGAHISPVTAKQVTDLLRLHFRGNAPVNVNASLRKYMAYVTPAAVGPPLLWSLTPKGLDHLRTLSGLALISSQAADSFDADIAFVCALEHPEFNAVMDALGGSKSWHEIGSARYAHVYRETQLITKDNSALKVIGTTSTSMGLTAAAVMTTQLVDCNN